MEYSLSFQDLLIIIKKNIKIVAVISVVCALLLCGYKIVHDKMNQSNLNADIEEQSETYQNWEKYKTKTNSELGKELVEAYKVLGEHPLMVLNIDSCKSRRIVFSFDEENDANRSLLIGGWINEKNTKEIFGKSSKLLDKYRNDLVTIDGFDNEAVITIFDSKEYNYNVVAKNIEKLVKVNAKKSGIAIKDYTNTEVNGFSQRLFLKQNDIRNNVVTIQNQMGTLKNDILDTPEGYKNQGSINLLSILIFSSIGLIMGALLSVILVLIKTFRKGVILSEKQVEELFGIENAGRLKQNTENEYQLINAITETLMGDNVRGVMIASVLYKDKYKEIAKKLNDIKDGLYCYGTIEIDSIEMLQNMKRIDKLLIPVELGNTTGYDLRNIIKWSEKYKKGIVGYIIIE